MALVKIYLFFRYYTEDSDTDMEVWVVVSDVTNFEKSLTLVVTPYKVTN